VGELADLSKVDLTRFLAAEPEPEEKAAKETNAGGTEAEKPPKEGAGTEEVLSHEEVPGGEVSGEAAGTEAEAEAEGAAEAKPEAGAEAEGDTEAEPDLTDLNLTPEQRKALGRKFSERIREAKESYRAKADAELARVKAELEAAKGEGAGAKAAAEAPVPLKQQLEQAQQAKSYAENLMDSLEDDPEAVAAAMRSNGLQPVTLDGKVDEDWKTDSVRRTLRQVAANAAKAEATAREQVQTHQAKANDSAMQAIKLVPELAKPGSEAQKLFRGILERAPWVKQDPEWPMAVAAQVLGIQRIQELAKAPKVDAKAEAPKLRKMPVKIPARSAVAETEPKTRGVSQVTVERALLEGDRNSRLEIISSFLQPGL